MCFEQLPFSLLFLRPSGSTYSVLKMMLTLSRYAGKWSFAKQHWPELLTERLVNPKIAAWGSKREVVKSFKIPSKLFCQAEMPAGRWSYLQNHLLSLRRRETLLSEPYRKLSSCPQGSLLKPEICQAVGKPNFSTYVLLPPYFWCLADRQINQVKRDNSQENCKARKWQ